MKIKSGFEPQSVWWEFRLLATTPKSYFYLKNVSRDQLQLRQNLDMDC